MVRETVPPPDLVGHSHSQTLFQLSKRPPEASQCDATSYANCVATASHFMSLSYPLQSRTQSDADVNRSELDHRWTQQIGSLYGVLVHNGANI
jgi:hypothetical protein